MYGTKNLNVKIFADGADLSGIEQMARNPLIKGFTTNPTLMRKANVSDYEKFAFDMLKIVPKLPVSFEVFSDDFDEMEQQALEITSWGENVFVKIPVSNTKGEFSGSLIRKLSMSGVQVNITALMTTHQVVKVLDCLNEETRCFISVFAGRIANTGRDPVPIMAQAVNLMRNKPNTELIWASPRELLNIFQADQVGCHIITVTNEILASLSLIGKDLDTYSLETVKMFRHDALAAGYAIKHHQKE